MGIRQFEIFASERRLFHTTSLQHLAGARVGIDGYYWLGRLLAELPRDGLAAALGGELLGLRDAIQRFIDGAKSNDIHPLFIFKGLSLPHREKPFSNVGEQAVRTRSADLRMNSREAAWNHYASGRVSQAEALWSKSGAIDFRALAVAVQHILCENNIEYFVAPYHPSAQLAYLIRHPMQPIHAVHAGPEALLFGIDQVITAMDLLSFTWLNRNHILHELRIDFEQLIDISIFAGFEFAPRTFPPLLTPAGFSFQSAVDMVVEHRNGYNAIQHYAEHPEVSRTKYFDFFCRTRCAIRFHPVLTDSGHVQPIYAEQAPADMHDIVGYRFPDHVYRLLARGAIQPSTLESLVSSYVVVKAPDCNGSDVFERLLKKMAPAQSAVYGQMKGAMHKFYQERKLTLICWYDPAGMPLPPSKIADSQLTDLSNSETVLAILSKYNYPGNLKEHATIISMILSAIIMTPEVARKSGVMIMAYLKCSDAIPEEARHPAMFEALLIYTMLSRCGAIGARASFGEGGAAAHSKLNGMSVDDSNAIWCISSVACLLPRSLTLKEKWPGPLDRNLLAFNSCAELTRRCLRLAAECALVKGGVISDTNFADGYPLVRRTIGPPGGLLMLDYLCELAECENEAFAKQKVAVKYPKEPEAVELLDAMLRFWNATVVLLTNLNHGELVPTEVYERVTAANRWLKERAA